MYDTQVSSNLAARLTGLPDDPYRPSSQKPGSNFLRVSGVTIPEWAPAPLSQRDPLA
jgi:hypothetical protein